MPKRDSVDKVVTSYFACLTREPFTYKGVDYTPKPLHVSPLLLRGFTCPPGCGGCCPRFSLDYIPSEERPTNTVKRIVEFNGHDLPLYSDLQEDHDDHHCRNLNKENGRCGIYLVRPFSCDFELIRCLHFADDSHPNTITQKLFGRGHAMLRIDDKRGALCTMTPVDPKTIADVIRKLRRFEQWSAHFRLKTWAPEIIKIVEAGRLHTAIILGRKSTGFFQ